jgi:MFS family permease
LAFAVLLLTGASLGDRFGRKLMLAIGMGIFAVASIGAALAPGVEVLVAAHAVQGVGGAIVAPLTLTIPSCFDTRGRLTLKMSAIAPCDLSGPRALPFEPCVGVHDAAWLSHFEHIIGEGHNTRPSQRA